MFWLLLSSALTTPRLSLQHSPLTSRLGETWEGTQPGQLTQTDHGDIPYHMTPAQQQKLRERRKTGCIRCYNACLLQQPLRALRPYFPGSSWTSLPADGKQRTNLLFSFASVHGFCFIKLPLPWPTRFFPSYFLPPHVLLRRGVIEWFGRHQASSQDHIHLLWKPLLYTEQIMFYITHWNINLVTPQVLIFSPHQRINSWTSP